MREREDYWKRLLSEENSVLGVLSVIGSVALLLTAVFYGRYVHVLIGGAIIAIAIIVGYFGLAHLVLLNRMYQYQNVQPVESFVPFVTIGYVWFLSLPTTWIELVVDCLIGVCMVFVLYRLYRAMQPRS